MRQAKIDEDRTFGRHHDVRRRDVAVHHSRRVRRFKSSGNALGHVGEFLTAKRPVRRYVLGERLSLDVFEDDERVLVFEFRIEDTRHGRVAYRHERRHLAAQTLGRHRVFVCVNSFESRICTLGVSHEVHLARAAGTKCANDHVTA